jgi:hypothetical protein
MRTIPADGSLVVHLGAARNVSILMNGQQVELPAGFRSVFDLTFQV